jgi:aldehyde:ferredoxin oxidoreductase
MLGGYMSKFLKVDLTRRTIETFGVGEDILRKYIGGCGLGVYFLRKYHVEDKDPLDPECPLIIMTGPLTASPAPCSGRHDIVAKSPLTGIWGEASSAGKWGSKFKSTGHDGIIVIGAAEKPVYILIENEKAQIMDASMLWGLDTYETGDKILDMYGKDYCMACIGPAGENLIPMANIMNDGRDARAAGRSGLGAVMGSKKLKAIVVRGNQKTPVTHQQEMKRSRRAIVPKIRANAAGLTKYGTLSGTVGLDANQDMPVKNWTGNSWPEGAAKISGTLLVEKGYVKKNYFCSHCVIGCGKDIKIEDRGFTVDGGSPEYEAGALLGSMLMIDDLEAICYANELCNRYGIDTMSTGGAIGFAFEAYEKGHLREFGVDMQWGSVTAMIDLIHLIGKGEGIGKILGKGSRYAAQYIGGDAMDYAMQVKGLELPGHDPRSYQSVALGYATSNRGACHLQAWSGIFEGSFNMPSLGYDNPLNRFSPKHKGQLVFDMQNLMSMFDSLTLCKYLLFGQVKVPHLVEWLNLTTGWDMTQDEFMLCGERIFTAKRQFNVDCGISRKDDVLPKRILNEPRTEGLAAGHLPKLDKMLPEYYNIRGWDDDGRPTPETLKRLKIE